MCHASAPVYHHAFLAAALVALLIPASGVRQSHESQTVPLSEDDLPGLQLYLMPISSFSPGRGRDQGRAFVEHGADAVLLPPV